MDICINRAESWDGVRDVFYIVVSQSIRFWFGKGVQVDHLAFGWHVIAGLEDVGVVIGFGDVFASLCTGHANCYQETG